MRRGLFDMKTSCGMGYMTPDLRVCQIFVERGFVITGCVNNNYKDESLGELGGSASSDLGGLE
jgi:hypothetical protein